MLPPQVVALVRTSPLRPVLSPPNLPSLRRPSTRTLAVAAGLVVAVVLAYVVARATPVFAVHEVAVSAPSPAVAAEVRAVVDRHVPVGSSLVALDAPALEARLRAIPSVRAATVDRAFPHTLAVRVEAERALAVVRDGERAWLLGASGRVMEEVEPRARPRLARIRVPLSRDLERGEQLADGPVAVALRVLDSLPRRLAREALLVTVESGRVAVVLRDRLEVRLAEPASLDAKVAAAAAVLRALPAEERAAMAYLDTTVPERVVVGPDVEPLGES